jgi:hypothetical protein
MRRLLPSLLLLACGRAEPPSDALDCCQTSSSYTWGGPQRVTLECNRAPRDGELPGLECSELETGELSCVVI